MTAPGQQISNHRADAKGDTHGLVGMRANNLIGGLGPGNRLGLDRVADLFGFFQCLGQALAGGDDFFLRHLGGDREQCPGILDHLPGFRLSFHFRFHIGISFG